MNLHSIQEEIKSRMKSGNACCHVVQNILSSSLLSQNVMIQIHRTIILPIVVYECVFWLLKLREEQGLRVFVNRVLRRIFGPKVDVVTGEWKELHNDMHSSPNIVQVITLRIMRWAGHVARMGERCIQAYGGET